MGAFAVGNSPKEGWNVFERVVAESVAPLQKAFRNVAEWAGGIVNGYVDLVHVRRENLELRERISAMTLELNSMREEAEASRRLRNLLNFSQTVDYPMVPAQVVGHDPSVWYKTLLIDKGTTDGVTRDDAVVNHEGVIGRVIAVSSHYAKVLLIIDRNSAVDALTQEKRFRGILVGEGEDPCQLKYMSPLNEVKPGERLVTSGMSRIFPKGLPLGVVKNAETVADAMFQKITVEPTVDFSRLEEVLVIVGPRSEEKKTP